MYSSTTRLRLHVLQLAIRPLNCQQNLFHNKDTRERFYSSQFNDVNSNKLNKPSIEETTNYNMIDTKITRLSSFVIDLLEKKPNCNVKVSQQQIEKLIKVLHNYEIDIDNLDSQFEETPDLLNYSTSNYVLIFNLFNQIGFSSEIIWRNIVLCPKLLSIPIKTLEEKVMAFTSFTMGKHGPFINIINKFPNLFLENHQIVLGQVEWLLRLFPPAETINLIKNCPTVLTHSHEDTYKKLEYITEETGWDQGHISDCMVLGRSLYYVKCRTQFMKRRGLLVKHKSKDRSTYKIGPSINDVYDTSNRDFVNRVSKSTWEEYEVFCKIMEEEIFDEDDDGLSDDEREMLNRLEYIRKPTKRGKRSRRKKTEN